MFEQHPDEPDRLFLLRVKRECAMIQHEAAFQQKFGVEVKRNAEGEIEEVRKLPKDPVQMMLKEARRQKKGKNAKTKESSEPRLTKSQKRRLKLAERKKKKMDGKVDGFKKFEDRVKFGEQAHAPPTLTAPKKVKNRDEVPRVNYCENLISKSEFCCFVAWKKGFVVKVGA